MVRIERKPLAGNVEVDETLVGGIEHGGKRGRGTDKCIVVIAAEIKDTKGFGRVHMRHVSSASGCNLTGFVCDAVSSGSVVFTDGWGGYNDLLIHGYIHNRIVLSDIDDSAHIAMPGVHRVASLLKRWMLGIHQGSFDSAHLQAYLGKFTFRFNQRTSRNRGLVFRRLIEQTVRTGPITCADVAHEYPW